jgi:hypothetical protein
VANISKGNAMTQQTTVPPWHTNKNIHTTNITHQWWPTDTEESFNRMMLDPVHRKYFQAKRWDLPETITYKINSDGFRSEEFDPSANNLVALGCSFTMGIGLPYSDLWPSRVAQALNLRACNFGWGGASSDQCFRLAEYWVPHLTPKLVVLLNPPRGRMEVVINQKTGETDTVMPMDNHPDAFVKKWLSVDENQKLNNRKNSLAIEAICNRLSIPFLSYEADTWMSRSREEAEYARDYLHAGPKGHKSFTERILDDWSKK